jgi:hypothetical protein
MTNEDLQAYFRGIGLGGEIVAAVNGARFIVGRDYLITKGSLVGRRCDVAVQWSDAIPYVPAPAIHTRPPLIPMGTRNTQASPLGDEWQYWSRRMVAELTPKAVVAHIATILSEV